MTFSRSLVLFGAAATLLGQTPPPKSGPMPVPGMPPQVTVEMQNADPKYPEVPPDRVIITVGDLKVTAAQFDQLVETLQPQYRTVARGPGRKQLADNIVQMLELAQEAQRRKMTDTSDYKSRVFFRNADLQASMLVEQIGKAVTVSDDDLKKYFEDHKTEYEQVHARHILIRFKGSQVPVRPGAKDLTDEEAKAKADQLRAKIVAGGDFAEIAKAESDDTSSGAQGGDVGTFGHGRMVPSFEVAAFYMKPGETSVPVKSEFGYHIIQVLSKDSKTFEEMKPEIEGRIKPEMQQKVFDTLLEGLKKSTPPVYDTEFFAPEKPADKAPEKK